MTNEDIAEIIRIAEATVGQGQVSRATQTIHVSGVDVRVSDGGNGSTENAVVLHWERETFSYEVRLKVTKPFGKITRM